MKYLSLVICLTLTHLLVSAQPTTFGWASTIRGDGWDQITDIEVLSDDRIATTGSFNDLADFDPGAEVFNLDVNGDKDVYLMIHTPEGALAWAVAFGGEGEDTGHDIVEDSEGNIYITGYFNNTVDFDPSENTSELTSSGSKDIFVSKFTVSGAFVWARRIGGSSSDEGNGIAVSQADEVYVTGRFVGDVDFDPGSGSHVLDGYASSHDAFLLKLDTDGQFQWAIGFGDGDSDRAECIAVDHSGNILLGGTFSGLTDFDPGPGSVTHSSVGQDDVFISKFSSESNFIWVHTFKSTSYDACRDLDIDPGNNIFLTGFFSGDIDFNPAGEAYSVSSLGAEDSYLVKLRSTGELAWARHIGGESLEWSYGVATDLSGDAYITGFFYNTVDFDDTDGVMELTSAGLEDGFICKFSGDGEIAWAKQIGGSNGDAGYGVDTDMTGNIYFSGNFRSTADLNPEAGVENVTSKSGADVFLVKLDQEITAVKEHDDGRNSLVISPNPGADVFTIDLSGIPDAGKTLKVKMYSLEGTLLHSAEGRTVHVPALPNGAYLITIERDNTVYSVPWIKGE